MSCTRTSCASAAASAAGRSVTSVTGCGGLPPLGDATEDVVVDAGVDDVLLRVVLRLAEVEVHAELRDDVDVDLLDRDKCFLLKDVDGAVGEPPTSVGVLMTGWSVPRSGGKTGAAGRSTHRSDRPSRRRSQRGRGSTT